MNREMKHSGIAWAELIPSHWNVERGKHVLTLMQRQVREDDEIITCFRDGEVILRKLRREDGFTMSDKEIGYQGINVGDIVIHGMDGFAGAIGVSKSQGKGTPVYVVCTTKDNSNNSYIVYYLRTLAQNNVFLALATGIRERSCDLKWNKISVLPFLLPPISEQKAIADFLDKKCGEIDELVALQEKIIEELKSYKQSVITETVCKGLNPNAPMKDSGVEWIGEIPEVWQVVKLGLLTSKIGSGSTPSGGAEVYTDDGVKFIRSQNVYFEGFNLTDVAHISHEIDEQMKGTRVQNGDILFNITGGSIGRCCDVDATLGEANVNQHVCIVRPTKIKTKYLKYYLQSDNGQIQVKLLQTGGNRDGLSADAFKKFHIVLPSSIEQQEIADYLDKKCSEIDQLISIKQQKIVELKEYKKSLIYEYTTGKKEV